MTASPRVAWWIAGAAVAILVYLLSPVLTPFIAAALLAYLGSPLVERLVRAGLPRLAAVTIVFLVIFLSLTFAVLITIPLIERQFDAFLQSWPRYVDWVQSTLRPWLTERLRIELPALDINTLKEALLRNWQQAGGVVAHLLTAVSQSWFAVFRWAFDVVLTPVLTFYLLRDWDRLLARVRALLPRPAEPTVMRLAGECNTLLAAFLRGQLWVMIGLGVLYSVGLWIVGLNLAVLIGMVAGLISFVPYLGFFVGLLSAAVTAIVQTGDASLLPRVLAVFVIAQSVESFVLTPLLVGDRVGLHPVAIIFAVLAGGQLFGGFGVLLAVPVAAVIAVLLREAEARYRRSELYGQAREPGEHPGDGPPGARPPSASS
jgi:predicted PurR-regulated permease PerM